MKIIINFGRYDDMARSYYDEDGFYVLIRKQPSAVGKPMFGSWKNVSQASSGTEQVVDDESRRRLNASTVEKGTKHGKHAMKYSEGEKKSVIETVFSRQRTLINVYQVDMGVKSWENKAWHQYENIPLRSHPFSGFRGAKNGRLSHVVRIISLYKVIMRETNSDNLTRVLSVPERGYRLIENLNDLDSYLTEMLTKTNTILKMPRSGVSNGYDVKFVMRTLVIYDDATYDNLTMDPPDVFKYFGITDGDIDPRRGYISIQRRI